MSSFKPPHPSALPRPSPPLTVRWQHSQSTAPSPSLVWHPSLDHVSVSGLRHTHRFNVPSSLVPLVGKVMVMGGLPARSIAVTSTSASVLWAVTDTTGVEMVPLSGG